jgi:thiol-disulfide isomerase/thioredoxin
MRSKILYLSTAILCLSFAFKASGQYKIVVNINDNQDSMMILGYYYLDKSYAADTAYKSKKGFVFEKKDVTLEAGIYFFTNASGKFCEFIIDKQQNFSLTTDEKDWVRNMKVKNSTDNVAYFDYLNLTNDLTDQVRDLTSKKTEIGDEKYNAQMNILRSQNDSLKEEFIKNYPAHLLSKVLVSTKAVIIPDSIAFKGDSLAWQREMFNYYKEHYFDNVDLSCDGLLRTPAGVFFNTYERYWTDIMQYESADSILSHAYKIIGKSTGKNMFRYVVHNIAERYLKSTIMGHDKVYVAMINKYYKTGEAWWMPPSSIESEVERAEIWENLLIGKTVPNFACPDSNKVWHDVYSLNKKYKIILFWAPECGHCLVEIPKFLEFYNKYKDKYNLEVLAVSTEGTEKEWKDKIVQNKTTWIDVYGLESTMNWKDYFDIETTPQVFVLDSNNVIVGKKIPGDNIEQYMEALNSGRLKP